MAENLRIVAMNAVLYGYQLIADWAERRGHHITLVVTPPASRLKRYGDAPHLPLVLPESQDVLVSAKLDTVAPRAIAPLEPDLVISSAFPRRIPPEVTAIPRYGAVNLHPAPLPRGRGPNPARLIYEGDLTAGGALHRIEPEDEALASYAAPFTEAEHWLSWDEPARTIQRRAAALNMLGPTARARLDG